MRQVLEDTDNVYDPNQDPNYNRFKRIGAPSRVPIENFRRLRGALRAFPYSLAGGRTIAREWPGGTRSGVPPTLRSVLFAGSHGAERKLGGDDYPCIFGQGSETSCEPFPSDHCIVLCDEAHNIMEQRPGLLPIQTENIREFGERIRHAKHSVVVLFTATPVIHTANEADRMLALIKGEADPRARAYVSKRPRVTAEDLPTYETSEGFVSWYMERPAALFAAATPNPVRLPCVHFVRIDQPTEQGRINPLFLNYLRHRFFEGTDPKFAETYTDQRGIPVFKDKYNHFCVDASAPPSVVEGDVSPDDEPRALAEGACKKTLASYEHVPYFWRQGENPPASGGRSSSGPTMLDLSQENMVDLVPKLAAIAHSVANTFDCPHRTHCSPDDFNRTDEGRDSISPTSRARDPHTHSEPSLPRCRRLLKTLIIMHEESGLKTLAHLLLNVYGLSVITMSPVRGLEGRRREQQMARGQIVAACQTLGFQPTTNGPVQRHLRPHDAHVWQPVWDGRIR